MFAPTKSQNNNLLKLIKEKQINNYWFEIVGQQLQPNNKFKKKL